MKKILGFFLLSPFFIGADYIRTPGPLNLLDQVTNNSNVERGAMFEGFNSKFKYFPYLKKICEIYGVRDLNDLPMYQNIMSDLDQQNISSDKAVALIKIFEYLIMDLVSDQLYFIGSYTTYASYVFTGIRYKWVNPFSWMNPFNYFGENNEVVYQLLHEMDQLANIATKYDTFLAIHLQATVFSYLHWRKVLLAVAVMACAPGVYNKIR
ncbi:hypothetical protein HYV10_00575 [Candidatus Dependentiae bacterium]|nr:hypothetical protein [Candidatus Dependentiae bacterium]